MKQLQTFVILTLLLLSNLSLWSQKADDYRAAANRGDKVAQYGLGVCYYYGYGVTKDHNQAVYWYTNAANQGYANAQLNLGGCYERGHGVTQDYKQAVYWYKKAANQGLAEAQTNLGACYYYGRGVTQDYETAVFWYTKAANQGFSGAQSNLGSCYCFGRGVAKDYKQAVYWLTKASNQGEAIAQANLGSCYENGYGVTQDYKQAVYWYTKAANQGEEFAQYNLGYCYYEGEGVTRDYKQAVYWYTKAANQGKWEAQMNLGICYYFGNGVAIDYEQAAYWWNKVINNPNTSDEGKQYTRGFLSWIDEKQSNKSNNKNDDGDDDWRDYYDYEDRSTTSKNESLTFTVNGISFVMKYVEGGTFQMGATPEQGNDAYDDESPVHSVTVSSYYLGETEVTQALWEVVMGNNPSNFKGENLPVESVNWNDCQEFIKKLNQITGRSFRLPTEAEWEYAARGGNQSNGYKYAGSNSLDAVAWYFGNSGNRIHAVKGKLPNELGLYDMSGNVSEWCGDWWGEYSGSSLTNPQGPIKDAFSRRVIRGSGSIRVGNSHIRHYRVSDRSFSAINIRSDSRGCRICLPQ